MIYSDRTVLQFTSQSVDGESEVFTIQLDPAVATPFVLAMLTRMNQ